MANKPQMQSQQLRNVSQNVDTFVPTSATTVKPSRASQLLDTLNRSIPQVAQGASNELGRIVEEDKTRQESLALNNMPVEDDATKAGRQAHKNVNTRNAVTQRMRELSTEAQEFEGTEQQWDDHIVETQNELINAYGDSAEDHEMIGSLVRDMLPKVADTRYSTVQRNEQIGKYRTSIDSFSIATDPEVYSHEQQLANVKQIFDEGGPNGGMNMTQEAMRKALVDSAIASAGRNELNLIEMTKELGIFEQEPGLVNAERQAQGRIMQESQAQIASDKSNIIDELNSSPFMSRDEWYAKAGAQEIATKGTWSEVQMRQEYDNAQRKFVEKEIRQSHLAMSLKPLDNEDAIPASFAHLSDKDKQYLVDDYDEYSQQRIAQETMGMSVQDDAEAIYDIGVKYSEEKAKWLMTNNIVDKKWEDEFNQLDNLSVSLFEKEELPPWLFQTLDKMTQLSASEGALSNHASTKAIGIHENYQRNLADGSTPVNALRDAQITANSPPVHFKGKERELFDTNVAKEVNKLITDTSWWPKFFTGNPQDADEATTMQVRALVDSRARDLLSVGHVKDAKGAIARAGREISQTYHQLQDGTLVYGNPSWIAGEMEVPVHQIDTMLNNYRDTIAENVVIQANATGTPDTWKPEITSGGNVVWRDASANIVGKPVALEVVGGSSLNQRANKLFESREEEYQKRVSKKRQMEVNLSKYGMDAKPNMTPGLM